MSKIPESLAKALAEAARQTDYHETERDRLDAARRVILSLAENLPESARTDAAKAIYKLIPNTHQELELSTATGQDGRAIPGRLISVPDTWEEAEDRHDQCLALAEAAIIAALKDVGGE